MQTQQTQIRAKVLSAFLALVLALTFVPITPNVEVNAKESAADTSSEQTLQLEEGTYDESQVIVKFKDTVESESVTDVLEQSDSLKDGSEGALDKIDENLATVDVKNGKTVEEAIKELEGDPRVEYVEPNYIATLAEDVQDVAELQTTSVNDPDVSRQWHITDENAKVQEAWDVARCDGNVSIAYIDSGIDTDHPDLVNNIVASYHSVGSSVEDNYGHGTAVAGILSAQTNNAKGVAGVSYNAKLVPIKAFENGTAGLDGIIKGIKWAIDNASTYNIKVINMSLGFKLERENSYTQSLREYVNQAYDAGILCVCASGNDSRLTGVSFPASISSTVAVGSIDETHRRALSSNGGDDLDVVAPGVEIYTTTRGGGYSNRTYFGDRLDTVSGTSFASPFVAATAALCFASNSQATPSTVKNAITTTAMDLGSSSKDNEYGNGQVVVSDAVAQVKGSQPSMNMWRLYNPYSGEHFYTASAVEMGKVVSAGWQDEGTGWTAPSSSKTPVYRLYNPYEGDHHYTTSATERDGLVAKDWRYESEGWFSDDSQTTPLLRQYNPNARTGAHNFTVDESEETYLVSLGWRREGIAWYGL